MLCTILWKGNANPRGDWTHQNFRLVGKLWCIALSHYHCEVCQWKMKTSWNQSGHMLVLCLPLVQWGWRSTSLFSFQAVACEGNRGADALIIRTSKWQFFFYWDPKPPTLLFQWPQRHWLVIVTSSQNWQNALSCCNFKQSSLKTLFYHP